jgi:CheY-like chemotaxis protein
MKKILIVEDDQFVATAYRKRFVEAGYEVDWAPDGLEGIKMVAAVKPDVVLLDLLMPRLDGIEVLKYIRSHPQLKHLPVVVFSNSYMTNLVENAWRAGADQCLMKASTTPAQLFDVVSKAIQKSAARMAAPEAATGPATPVAQPASNTPTAAAPAMAAPRIPQPAAPIPGRPVVSPLPSRPPTQPPFVIAGQSGAAPGLHTQREIDPEFQAQIRALFLSSAPAKLSGLSEAAAAFVNDQGSSMQLPLLTDLFRRVHSFTGNAAVAGCAAIAQYASTLEAFLQELQQKPKFINDSTVRTVSNSVKFLETLFQHAGQSESHARVPVSILVVDGNEMSSQAITMALDKAEYQTSLAGDPVQALGMFSAGAFDAVVMAVDLPGMSGFELYANLQTSDAFAQTPVIFVTSLNDFAAHANPEVLGTNDLIAAPFLLIELTLKAITHVEQKQLPH